MVYFVLLAKLFWIFINTLIYILRSLLYPQQTDKLKKKWAQSTLAKMGYTVHAQNINQDLDWNRPLILVGNHISFLDILVLLAAHPQAVFLSKIEVKNWPIIGWGARRAGTLFVDRSSMKGRKSLREQILNQLLKSQSHLVIFPSGTTTLDENISWKKGAFEIAASCQIPVQTFKINYLPLRESAYIDNDQLLKQMLIQLRIPNKKAYLDWGNRFKISDIKTDITVIKEHVLAIK